MSEADVRAEAQKQVSITRRGVGRVDLWTDNEVLALCDTIEALLEREREQAREMEGALRQMLDSTAWCGDAGAERMMFSVDRSLWYSMLDILDANQGVSPTTGEAREGEEE